MYPDLNGKTAVVTGASVGLGHGIARRFLQEGMSVVVNFHSDKHRGEAQKLADEFNAPGKSARVMLVQADISQEDGAPKLRDAALEHFGGIDVWEKTLAVNLTGVFLGSKAALGHFVEQDRKGCIVNLSSVHERIPWPTFAHYAASKGGVKLFSETIALEYAHLGIRVNCIAPGAIETPINAEKFEDPEARAQTERMIPLHRIGTVEQVAAAAAWLASDESSYVTGTSLFVDGGMALYPSFERGDG